MPAAKAVGADRIELYTEPYAAPGVRWTHAPSCWRFAVAAQAAVDVGLGVNAGMIPTCTTWLLLRVRCRRAGGIHWACLDCRCAGVGATTQRCGSTRNARDR